MVEHGLLETLLKRGLQDLAQLPSLHPFEDASWSRMSELVILMVMVWTHRTLI